MVLRRETELVNGFWTGHGFGVKSGAVVTLLPVAASAMVWRFVKLSNPSCTIPLLLWIQGAYRTRGGRCRCPRQAHPGRRGRLASQTTSEEIGDQTAEHFYHDIRDGASAHLEYHPCSQESHELASY